jgi:ferredoxin-fold anticodon binding domain-containing protein
MKTIPLKGSAGAKIKALEPFVGKRIALNTPKGGLIVGKLERMGEYDATILQEASGNMYTIKLSNLSSFSAANAGNWKATSSNGSSARTERLQIRCTLEQRVAIESAANLVNKSISDFILQCALTTLWSP